MEMANSAKTQEKKDAQQPVAPSVAPSSENAEFEPEFIDSTEENHLIILAGVSPSLQN
jgi:hypothetical protein